MHALAEGCAEGQVGIAGVWVVHGQEGCGHAVLAESRREPFASEDVKFLECVDTGAEVMRGIGGSAFVPIVL